MSNNEILKNYHTEQIPQRTGGLNISNHSNRFIFWKTRGNILELVEHSLDVNVAGNQLRYKFEDSPVLGDSISMYETKQNIVLLVATISSVHKIKFPRPKVISTRHEYVNSIFADPGAAESINNPASYHIINTASTLPYTGASYLTPEREAIFALALQSGSVAIVKINPNTEKAARVFDIKNDSFFGGLNFFSTKSRGLSQDGSILGMVVKYKYVKKSLYFVTLSFDGQLKCWNSEMSLVGSCDALNYCKTRNLGIQSHLIRKPAADLDPSLWIYFCLEGGNSCFMQFEVSQRGTIDFRRKATDLPHLISTQMDQLIDFLVLNNLVWCVWHTLENESVVTAYDMDSQNSETWQYAQLEPLQINPTSPALCPQGKISDLIFKPGLFSRSDVAKALEINNGNTVDLEPHLTLRQKVMLVMERDIDAKISELPDDMDEGSRAASEHFISEQIWEDFYSACIQYRKMSLPPLGMLNITSANLLLLIKKNSFSFLRPLAEIENNNPSRDISGIMTVSPRRETSGATYRDFDKFVTSLNALSLDNNSNQEIALVLTDGKKEPGSEDLPALSGSKQFCQLLNEFAAKSAEIFEDPSELTRLRSLSDGELRVYIERFLDILNTAPPSDVVPGSQYYSSLLGVNVLTMAMNQIAELRLRLCCNLLIVLRTRESTLFNCYYKDLWRQIRDMWIITWLHNNTDANTQDSVLVSYEEVSEWDWIFLNDIGDYVSSSKLDIGALMWALLEALLDIFELPGQKYALRAVCEKLDIGALMWALLEALLDIFELPGQKYALRAVCEKVSVRY
ncbi:nuclear pore complex protein Nup160 [Diaphorina citri]|uniref:Nuclear pore complex protein Nup160 n=1 Tax=Diaphorina citri TaxID=121845 RepID=A0A3Q0IRE7_DIACI|nr:nuclear pore complex protein Nup160 [Diaphorina citri]